MPLEESAYVPTLAIRPSEMNGLEQLPGLIKDRMRPLFLLAPWANANSIARAVERAERAYPERPYFLELDRDYSITNLEADAQREFVELQSPHDCFANWWAFVARFPNAIPCLQLREQSVDCIRAQIDRAQQMGRGFCLRVVLSRYPFNLADAVAVLNAVGTADYSIVLEGGWTEDPLVLAARFSGLIGGGLGEVDADVPVVVSCTSMPREFQEYEGCVSVPFSNRALVAQIAREHNLRRVIYGDWGSTRPREPPSYRQRPIDRIDYPIAEAWIISRNRNESWNYRDAAEELVRRSGYWDDEINVWGTHMIIQTLANPDFGINSPQKNVASRVNIHLHRQAFFNQDLRGIDFDDEWRD